MRVSITGLLQAAAVVTVVFSVVSALPVQHFGVQLFSHFRLQYLVVSVLLLVALVAMRQPAFAVAMLITTAVNAGFVIPWYLNAPTERGDTSLTVMQANVLSTNTQHDKVLQTVAAANPDLVVFQEVTPEWLVALASLKSDYPHSYAEARAGNFGIAVFSRLPLLSVTHVDSPPFAYPTILAKLGVGDDVVNVVATHPTIPVSGGLYDARNQHLESLDSLLEGLDGSTVVIGDLNTAMWDLNYKALEARQGLRNARRGFGVVPTWPTFMPPAMIPIDHVLVSEDIHVEDVRTGARMGSDHLPLVVTLSL